MKHLTTLATYLVLLAASLPGYADQAGSAYKHGVYAEAKNDYDAAYEAYNKAHTLKPRDPKYLAAYVRVRFYAAADHVHSGQLLRDEGKLAEALAHFQRAAAIDPSNFVAAQEARRTTEMIKKQEHQEQPVRALPESPLSKMAQEVEGPIELKTLSTTPINLRMSENVDMIYKVIGKLAGVNVLVDAEYRPQKISIELNDVTPREALDMVALQSKTFWQPISTNTIFVAADSTGKRKELQGNVMKTFYLKNVSTSADLQEAANTLKGILDLNRVQLIANQNAMILRGTTDQMILAEKLLNDIDKPKAEVVIDVAVMQVSRDRIRNMGTNPPTSANITLVPGAGTSGGSGSGGSLTLNTLKNLNANNFQVSIPGASVTALMSDSNTKLLQNPEIRVLDNEKATLKIGDRVPVATGSFQSGIGVGSVNTQFQYLDVGVNIDIVPHIHSENEVTLKMVLEISSVTGTENIGGISQPIIGQRRIEHETRLQDGEVNLVGGILEDSETQSLSGYPWLTKIPILKYFFGQTDKERRENEIIFAITPHIVRAQDVTEQNLRMVDVGTGNLTGIRHKDVHSASAGSPAAGTSQSGRNTATGQKKIGTDNSMAAPTTRPGGPTNPPTPVVDPKMSGASPIPTAQQSPPPSKNGAGSAVARAAPIATPEPPVLAATAVSIDSSPLPSHSPAPSASISRDTSQYSRERATDPCPYGQHTVEIKKDTVTCAFD
jgi:general secretion pathway protein D